MPDIEYAFLADAADAQPGQKFAVLGGGVSRIGGPSFPLRHPHLAIVVGLKLATRELGSDHELRFVVADGDGAEVSSAAARIRAEGQGDSDDAILTFSLDLWNLTFASPGAYSIQILVDDAERKRLPLVVERHEGLTGDEMLVVPPVVPPFPPPTGQA
jgi:hypothetical protein